MEPGLTSVNMVWLGLVNDYRTLIGVEQNKNDAVVTSKKNVDGQ
jgi:hypothetical protein